MAKAGILRVHRQERTLTFQLEGTGAMAQSLPLRHAAEKGLADGATELRVDLRRCTYMDSTFLGTLLFLLRKTSQHGPGRFALVSPSPECRELIEQMGLADVYPVTTEAELPVAAWTEIPIARADHSHVCRNVAQAHQELATLPGAVGATFKQVADCLAREADAVAPKSGEK